MKTAAKVLDVEKIRTVQMRHEIQVGTDVFRMFAIFLQSQLENFESYVLVLKKRDVDFVFLTPITVFCCCCFLFFLLGLHKPYTEEPWKFWWQKALPCCSNTPSRQQRQRHDSAFCYLLVPAWKLPAQFWYLPHVEWISCIGCKPRRIRNEAAMKHMSFCGNISISVPGRCEWKTHQRGIYFRNRYQTFVNAVHFFILHPTLKVKKIGHKSSAMKILPSFPTVLVTQAWKVNRKLCFWLPGVTFHQSYVASITLISSERREFCLTHVHTSSKSA